MLYQLGPVSVDVYPFSIDTFQREASADYAKKDIISGAPNREFMGEGDESLSLEGQILPLHIGGLTELETLHDMRRSGTRLMVTRGDGMVLGWHAIENITENHEDLVSSGIGIKVNHTIKLIKVDAPGMDEGMDLLNTILSLFG